MKHFKPLLASALTVAMLVSMGACGGSNGASSGNSGEGTVIKVQTFNNPGFGAATSERPGADLWKKFEEAHPGVKVEETAAASSDDARAAFNTAISTGSNAYDVYLTEVDWMLNEFKVNNVEHYFLYTDTDCDYGFYEDRGMVRRMEMPMEPHTPKEDTEAHQEADYLDNHLHALMFDNETSPANEGVNPLGRD